MSGKLRRYARAMRALCENAISEYADGIREDTPEFLLANREVADAERGVPWLARWLIDRRIIRQLNYWNRTGGTG